MSGNITTYQALNLKKKWENDEKCLCNIERSLSLVSLIFSRFLLHYLSFCISIGPKMISIFGSLCFYQKRTLKCLRCETPWVNALDRHLYLRGNKKKNVRNWSYIRIWVFCIPIILAHCVTVLFRLEFVVRNRKRLLKQKIFNTSQRFLTASI